MKKSNLFSFNELRAQSKYIVLAASLLTLVACGNSKENKSPMPQGPVVTDGAPNPGTPPNGNQVGDNDLQPQAPQSDLNNNNGQVLPSLPAAPAGRPGRGGAPVHDSNGATGGDNSSVLRPPLQAPEQNDLIAASLQFDEIVAVKTGGKSGELNYTSAGADGLMEEFKSYNSKVGAKQQEMNQNLAKSIVSAKIRRSVSTGEIFVDLIVDEFGKTQSYVLKANEDDGDKMQLTYVKSSGDLEFQGGFLKCTDLDGGCENAYVKMKLEGAYARVIFRNSYSDAHFLVQKDVSNPRFDLWKSYIANTITGSPLAQKIDYVQMSSFEIVNGRAGLGAMIITQDLDMIGLSIPLLAPEKGTKLNAPVAKLSDLSKNYDLAPLASTYTQHLSNALTDVRLVNNNGLGQMKLQLKLSAQGQQSASIWLVLSSVKKPTMSVDDVRAFEAGIKPF